jgi:dolichol-phosphate mannosyltransferase
MIDIRRSRSLVPAPTGVLSISSIITPTLSFSLVIPTYEERHNIQELVHQLSTLLDEALPDDYEIIVVDDDSPDSTWELAQSLMPEYPQLRVMRRQGERGLSTAVIRGWQVAKGNILGVIDGDLQHPPEVLVKMLTAMKQGADLAVASRHLQGGGVSTWSLGRRIFSRGAQLLGLLILPEVVSRVSDPMSGYFLIHRSHIANRVLNPFGYKILLEVLGRGTARDFVEIPYVFRERQQDQSKVTFKQYVDYVRHLIRLRWDLGPIKRFVQFGLVGLSGVLVDMTVLYLLSDPGTLGWGITQSKIIAAELALINNFFWNERWTFRDISSQSQQWDAPYKRLLKFHAICLLGIAFSILILNLFVYVFHMNQYLANLIAIVLTAFWNFGVNAKINWKPSSSAEAKIP